MISYNYILISEYLILQRLKKLETFIVQPSDIDPNSGFITIKDQTNRGGISLHKLHTVSPHFKYQNLLHDFDFEAVLEVIQNPSFEKVYKFLSKFALTIYRVDFDSVSTVELGQSSDKSL